MIIISLFLKKELLWKNKKIKKLEVVAYLEKIFKQKPQSFIEDKILEVGFDSILVDYLLEGTTGQIQPSLLKIIKEVEKEFKISFSYALFQVHEMIKMMAIKKYLSI